MADYIRKYFVLFLLMTVLGSLVPDGKFQKYIRFFSELVLVTALLAPILQMFGDGDSFLLTVQYEEFAEELNELTEDTGKIGFLQNDYYVEKYGHIMEENIKSIAETAGCPLRRVTVKMAEDYTVKEVMVYPEHRDTDFRMGEEVVMSRDTLTEWIADYCQIEKARITVCGD